MQILVIASALLLMSYIIIMAKLNGIQSSISNNYYVSDDPHSFMITMVAVGLSMTPVMLMLSNGEWYQFTGFFTGAGIIFVGVAAEFHEPLTREVHMTAACLSAISAVIWSYATMPLIAALATVVAMLILLFERKNTVYWLELTMFVMVYTISLHKLF